MQHNVDFIAEDWPFLYESAVEAEKHVFLAPRTSAFYSRHALEQGVRWLFQHDSSLRWPNQDNLYSLLHEPSFRDPLEPRLFKGLDTIRKVGNQAVHQKRRIQDHESLNAFQHLFHFLKWMNRRYSQHPRKQLKWDDTLLWKQAPHEQILEKTAAELRELEKQTSEIDRALQEQKKKNTELLKKFEAIKEQNRQMAFEDDLYAADNGQLEAETRRVLIDLMLKEAGWDPSGEDVEEYYLREGAGPGQPGYADYVLWGDDGKPLAVIEAKRTAVDVESGREQARRYADALEKERGRRPVIFYSNGYETRIWDDLRYPPREVQGFYTKQELERVIERRNSLAPLHLAKINTSIVERPYQIEAIRRVTETLEQHRRHALLVMATGSGKTRTAAALVDLLSRCNWVKRVLFLADRVELVDQAQQAFVQHLPGISTANLLKRKEKDDLSSRVLFSTYPTLMNRLEETPEGQRTFGVGHFDLIIIDESHRSIYRKYQALFDYFDAMLIGLTATPKADLDRNTYAVFQLEDHQPTYAYELDQAVADGYLVPPERVNLPMKFDQQGIKYSELSEEEKAQYEETFTDESTGEMPEEIDASHLNNWLFNQNTVDLVLDFLMKSGLTVAGGERLGKTIIFAKNHDHATFIQKRFEKLYPKYKGKFSAVIDYKAERHQQLLKDFKQADKDPHIAISVDMLDTGIDIHEILNLVFFKKVRSKSKYWQMIGRGTRRCDHLFGPGQHKEKFYVFDFCDNYSFFEAFPDGVDAKPGHSLSEEIFGLQVKLLLRLQELRYQEREETRELHQQILNRCHQQISRLDLFSLQVRPIRKFIDPFLRKDRWNNLSDTDALHLIKHVAKVIQIDGFETAKRFDKLMMELQLAALEGKKIKPSGVHRMREIGEKLERKGTIPEVREKKEIIRQVQRDDFWKEADPTKVEKIRLQLRNLIRYIDRDQQEPIYTNFEDEILDMEIIEHKDAAYHDWKEYKKKIENTLFQSMDHPCIQKLFHNQKITHQDLRQLESIFFSDQVGSREQFEKVYGKEKPLSVLVREMLGLDQQAAQAAFSQVLQNVNLSANQIQFIQRIIQYLVENGRLEPEKLFADPFTQWSDEGILGVFPEPDAKTLLSIVQGINANAEFQSELR